LNRLRKVLIKSSRLDADSEGFRTKRPESELADALLHIRQLSVFFRPEHNFGIYGFVSLIYDQNSESRGQRHLQINDALLAW
jgi:hypothetical protein